MLNKLEDPRWRGMFIGLITGLLIGTLVLISGDDSIKPVNIFIISVGFGLSVGSFIGFLIAAGTNFITGLRAALFCGLFFGLAFLLAGSREKEITFLSAVLTAVITSIAMILTYSLAAVVVIGVRRIRVWQGFKNWLEKKVKQPKSLGF